MTPPATNSEASLPEDVTLHDLLAGFWRRRWLILAVTLAVGGLGTLTAFLRPPAYEYVTLIEIAMTGERESTIEFTGGPLRFSAGDVRPVEASRDVDGKLTHGYLPRIVAEYRGRENTPDRAFEVEVRRASESLVTLHSEGPERFGNHFKAIHQEAVARVKEDHSDAVKSEHQRLRARLEEAKAEFDSVRSLIGSIRQQIEALGSERQELRGRLGKVKSRIGSAELEAEGEAARSQGQPTEGHLRERRRQLEERLYRGLPARLAELRRERAELEQRAAKARARLGDSRARLKALRDTRAVAVARQSSEPIGGGMAMAWLFWVLGAVVGLVAGGVAEVGRRFRHSGRGGE